MISQQIRDSARGEQCTLKICGICNGDPTTTVLAHLPDESHGMAKKSDDISACYACAACHDAADGRKQAEWQADDIYEFLNHSDWYFRRAMVRTWRRLIEKGIITIKGMK